MITTTFFTDNDTFIEFIKSKSDISSNIILIVPDNFRYENILQDVTLIMIMIWTMTRVLSKLQF